MKSNSATIKRNQLQQEAREAFIQTAHTSKPYCIALYMGTGIGKSKTAIDCAIWHEDNVEACDTLIVCHSESSRDITWPEQLEKWAGLHSVSVAETVCYQSLSKIKGRRLRVILDEAHYLTERNHSFFTDNEIISVIVLTATQPRDKQKRDMLRSLIGGNQFNKTADAAIEEGILNNYHVYQFNVNLDNTKRYVEMEGTLVTEQTAYFMLCGKLNRFKSRSNSTMIKLTYIEIMRFLGTCRTKCYAATYLMNQLRERNRRFIVFCQSKDQADQLSRYPYHSGTDDSNFNRFCAGEINELSSVRQIQEGANIPELDRAINIQLNSNPINIIQRTGRLLRKEVGTTSAMFIIVMNQTFDIQWAYKALSETPPEKITTQQLDHQLYWPIA